MLRVVTDLLFKTTRSPFASSLHMVLGVTLAIYQAVYQFAIITIYTINVSKMIIMDHT